jgi:KDO2-lipid IV(A) lauroyltransferase
VTPAGSSPAEVVIPRAQAPWLSRAIFRAADVLLFPLLHFARMVLGRLERRAALAAAARLGAVLTHFGDVATFRRNLRVVRRDGDSPEAGRLIAAAMGHQIQHMVDIIQVLDHGRVPLLALVEGKGDEHLAQAREAGRGVILVSSHMGNWELGAAWIAARGFPLHVLYFEQLSLVLDGYLHRVRCRHGLHMVHQRRGLREAIGALKKNEILGVVADQDGTRNGVFAEFFGVLVSIPRGAMRLAIQRQCPLVHTWNLRRPDGSYEQCFSPAYWPPQDGPEAEQLLARRILSDYETVIRENPEQWLLSYDRFKLRHVPRLEELSLKDRAIAEQRWIQAARV